MGILNILNMAKSYFILGLIAAILLTTIFSAGYFIFYKKIFKGQRRLSKLNILWILLFISYITVVLGATLLNRSNIYGGGKIVPLFYSYKEAWISFNSNSWRNLILNILMFVPFGFLLPAGIKKCRKFVLTSLFGLLFTTAIETIQLIVGLGIFELDDIFNNTIGAMIGFGFFSIWNLIISKGKNNRRAKLSVILSQIPLIVVVGAFTIIFAIYQNEELGHLDIQYINKIPSKQLTVKTDRNYSDKKEKFPVYSIRNASVDETEEFANNFFGNLGGNLDKNSTDIYSDTAVYCSDNGLGLWINYNGMTYSYTDYNTLFPEEEGTISEVNDADEETVKSLLLQYMSVVPENAEFSNKGMGAYSFEINQFIDGKVMYDGTINCEYFDNGKFGSIDNNIITCEYFKDYPVISENEALEKICNGEFNLYLNDDSNINIELGEVSIEYITDTKGYYQPVYSFAAKINHSDAAIVIPAIP